MIEVTWENDILKNDDTYSFDTIDPLRVVHKITKLRYSNQSYDVLIEVHIIVRAQRYLKTTRDSDLSIKLIRQKGNNLMLDANH